MESNQENILLYPKQYLESQTDNTKIISDIEDFVCEWEFESQYDLLKFAEDVNVLIDTLLQRFFGKCDIRICKSLHCVVHQIILDCFLPIIRAKYNEEDKKIYDRCLLLSKSNQVPIEKIDSMYCSVPYTAAIVELSMWDSHKSPLEKLNCLCSTYDIIFAELKTAMVDVISKYSDKEIELPIIDNKDVIPIIVIVILKSKLKHTYSNLRYIELFCEKFIDIDNNKSILHTFEQAIQIILNTDKLSEFNCNQCSNIDFCKVLEDITEESLGKSNSSCEINLENENKKRLATLIVQSTTSNLNKVP